MITRLDGQLVDVSENAVVVRVGDVTYDLLIPVCDEIHWRNHIGEQVHLQTFHYLESQGQGNYFLPRLIGFIKSSDRKFFELFTKVKGIGYRKAVRVMAMPTSRLADAIASRDVAVLKTLPEIGKRTAETIITELHDKVGAFITDFEAESSSASTVQSSKSPTNATNTEIEAKPGQLSRHAMARDALSVLVQLGENRATAMQWIDKVLADTEDIESVEHIVSTAFRYREG